MTRSVVAVVTVLLLAAAPAAARTLPPPAATTPRGVPVTAPPDAVTSVEHPSLPIRYTATGEVTSGRTAITIEDVSDPADPVPLGEVLVGAVLAPRSLAVDPAGQRLYVAVSTNTHVLDLRNAVRPVPMGRMADYMVRNHESVQVAAVVDPSFGPRELLLIGSRLGGGPCWTGTVHVYDVTGGQRDAPVTLLESDVPRVASGDSCPAAQLLVDGADRRLRLAWTADGPEGPLPVRTDIVRYDTTTAFIDRVGVCPLAPPV